MHSCIIIVCNMYYNSVGFTSRQLIMINESVGMVNLTIELISGRLCGEVEITFFNDSSFNTTGRADHIVTCVLSPMQINQH